MRIGTDQQVPAVDILKQVGFVDLHVFGNHIHRTVFVGQVVLVCFEQCGQEMLEVGLALL